MICKPKIIKKNQDIDIGDILIYSEHKAYLIISSNMVFEALQIFNNGNDALGYINYSDKYLQDLIARLKIDYGEPKKIIHIKNVEINFTE